MVFLYFKFQWFKCRSLKMTARLSYVSDNEVTQDEVKYLQKEGKDYCLAHGMVYKDSKGEIQHIPFTLYPSPIPLELFTDAKDVQTDFNLLVHKVSRDYEFTKNALLRYSSYYSYSLTMSIASGCPEILFVAVGTRCPLAFSFDRYLLLFGNCWRHSNWFRLNRSSLIFHMGFDGWSSLFLNSAIISHKVEGRWTHI